MRPDQTYPQCNLPTGYQGGGREPIAVELYKDDMFEHWFPTIAAAAKWLGLKQNTVSQAIKRGHKTKGYEIRVSKSIADTIAEFNKPYQFNRQ